MTLNANYTGNIEKPVHQALSGTSATQIGVAAPNDSLTLSGWTFANTTASPVTCQIIHRQGGVDYVHWVKSVAATSTEVESSAPIRLQQDDIIKAVGNTGVTVNLIYTASYALGR